VSPIAIAQILSLLTALGFAAGDTAVHRALRTSTPVTGIFTLSLITLIIYGPIALATYPLGEIGLTGFFVFLAAGIASPGLAGTLLYMSFLRIGLSRSVTVISGAPLLTVIFAVGTLGERPTALVYLGTVSIVAGVMFLAQEHRTRRLPGEEKKSVWHSFVFAAGATLMFAVTAVLRKIGVTMIPSLSVGLSIAALGSLCVILLWNPFLPEMNRIRITRQDIWFFVLSGVLSSSGHLAFFAALQMGPLSTVAPLVYSAPMFALIFSWLLFRKEERLNFYVVAGAILICAGAAFVTMARG
jgi:transporter family protein